MYILPYKSIDNGATLVYPWQVKNGPLPPPEELATPRDDVKVTLALSRRSISFFKDQARRRNTKYQRMIRELVDRYAAHFGGKEGGKSA